MDDKRFWRKVDKSGKCWLWIGKTKHRQGYGFIYRANRNMLTHRWAWLIERGAIPDGMMVLHKCDNPSCVNPEHLFLGTQTDNMRDMANKGRGVYPDTSGENNGGSKLTVETVKEIRKLYQPRKMSCTMLGKKFNISRATIHLVVQRKIWKHVA